MAPLLIGCLTPKGDFLFDTDNLEAAFKIGKEIHELRAERDKNKEESKNAKWEWIERWNDKQVLRKERQLDDAYEKAKEDMPEWLNLWKEFQNGLSKD